MSKRRVLTYTCIRNSEIIITPIGTVQDNNGQDATNFVRQFFAFAQTKFPKVACEVNGVPAPEEQYGEAPEAPNTVGMSAAEKATAVRNYENITLKMFMKRAGLTELTGTTCRRMIRELLCVVA